MIAITFNEGVETVKSSQHVYQWDKGQKLVVGGVSNLSITDIHFSFKGLKTAYVVKVTTGTNTITADVPNKVLTYGKDIYAYLCVKNSNGNVITMKTVIIPVIKRDMPENYMYDDDETVETSLDELQTEIQRSTAVDTEHETRITSLEEAKTNASGTTFETLKERIDEDYATLYNSIDTISELISYDPYKYITQAVLSGYVKYSTGEFVEDTNFSVSNYLPLDDVVKISIEGYRPDFSGEPDFLGICFYDIDKNFIDGIQYPKEMGKVEVLIKKSYKFIRYGVIRSAKNSHKFIMSKIIKSYDYDRVKNTVDAHVFNYTSGMIGNSSDRTYDKYLSYMTGNTIDLPNYNITGYIPINDAVYIGLDKVMGTNHIADSRGLCFYDENKNYISGVQYPNGAIIDKVPVPYGAVYVRYTYYNPYSKICSLIIFEEGHRIESKGKEINIGIDISSKSIYISGISGTETEYQGYRITDFIDISNVDSVDIVNADESKTTTDYVGYAIYDRNKNAILSKPYPLDRSKVSINIPNRGHYIRFTINENNLTQFKFIIHSQYGYNGNDLPLAIINDTPDYIANFLRVGCIGDSLCSGESTGYNASGTYSYVDNYDFSWGKNLERMTGCHYEIFSKGGLRADTWLSSEYATRCFDPNNKCFAYIIGLGENDANKDNTIGTENDIDLNNYNNNANTYYGNYGKIIQKIKELQPKARIFVLTDPKQYVEDKGYNTAVRTISSMFDKVYLCDLYKYGQQIYNGSILNACARGGHFNAIGYRYCAKIIATYIDWIIKNNISEFRDIEFIGTDYSPN